MVSLKGFRDQAMTLLIVLMLAGLVTTVSFTFFNGQPRVIQDNFWLKLLTPVVAPGKPPLIEKASDCKMFCVVMLARRIQDLETSVSADKSFVPNTFYRLGPDSRTSRPIG